MQAVILAASRGEQFGGLTEDIPKCMLPFGHETILERQIRILEELGIESSEICVVAGYKPDKLEKLSRKKGFCLVINEKYEITDNSYSLWLALQRKCSDVLVLDGDLIYEEETLRSILEVQGNAVLIAGDIRHDGNTGVRVANDGRLTEIGKHLPNGERYTGIIKFTPETAKMLLVQLKNNTTTWYTVALNRILEQHEFRVCYTPHYIIDINTYADYLAAKRRFGIEQSTIWVTGASGFLGQKIYHILKRNHNVFGTKGKSETSEFQSIDLLDKEAIMAYAKLINPNIIVHTAGIPEPEKCNEDKVAAYRANVEVVKNLVEICAEMRIKLIHISTDYVFDGESEGEYGHNAERRPKNYYGQTKMYAEDEVLKYTDTLIIRVPLLYGYNNRDDKETFPAKILHKLGKGEKVFLDNKQIRYPVLIDDVAFGVADSLHKRGVIHITSSEPVTKYTWGKALADEFGYSEELIQEDMNSSLDDRPPHVKLHIGKQDYSVTDARRGAEILRKQMACVFQLIYKSSPADNAYGINIGSYRYSLGKKLASVLPDEIVRESDYVVPVPSSGLYYAMGLAEEIKVPYLQALIKPDELTRSFQISDIALREQIIRHKILPIRELLANKSIILVDEAIFTGITLRIVCDMIKACGSRKIYIALPTPICRNVCRQYVQPERRLLSQDVDEEGIAKYFKVDGVFFQKYCVFDNSVSGIENICRDCFCG